ncbi:MAG: hypothetical protein MMC33_005574 [Icmadophila ericetorum]|nr:hypothetical protein [Icmadophila ericetorum]
MCLVTLLKISSKFVLIKSLQKDDYYMILAMVLAIGQNVAVTEQVTAGLGQHMDSLTESQVEAFQGTGYASQLLYILSLCITKLAVLEFLGTLAQSPVRRTATRSIMAVNGVWAIIATFCVAFQCGIPRPWAIISGHCFNQVAFWNALGAFDIMIDFAIVILPVYLLHDLKLVWKKKASVMAAFAGRLLIVPLTILRLIYITSTSKSADHTWDEFDAVATTQIIVNLSVVVACIPFLKPFLDSLQTGAISGNIRLKPLSDNSAAKKAANSLRSRKDNAGNGASFHFGSQHNWMDSSITHTTLITTDGHSEPVTANGSSNSSESMRIKQTTGVTVQFESYK